MTVNDLSRIDSDFEESIFITKVNSRIKKIYNAITLGDVDTVKHFMSDELYSKIIDYVKNNDDDNKIVIYDEVNISSAILNIDEDNNNYIITVDCVSKFLKYFISKNSREYLSGDMDNRIELNQKIKFYKSKTAKSVDVVRCLGCGANFNINSNGICPHCGRTYDLEKFDYIISDMEL